MYYGRLIDYSLKNWAAKPGHKPLLLRGARQVGKSKAVQHLGESFGNFIEINFEKDAEYKALFRQNLDVRRIVPQISAMSGQAVNPGQTLLFLDEIQECPEAIMSLRFFREDLPELHVVAAGSLLELALDELPTFGVGRIHSMYMYPMTFDEFLNASGEALLMDARNHASPQSPLAPPLHDRIVQLFREYMIVGGMPEVVSKWAETKDFLQCQEIQDDILSGYEDDFPKYRKKADSDLLRKTLRSVAVQLTRKFTYVDVGSGYKAAEVIRALDLLDKAGIIIPVTYTSADGLPLESGTDRTVRKMLLLDSGLALRLLFLSLGDIRPVTAQILTAEATELVNKGPLAEMIAGLELLHYRSPDVKGSLHYWVRKARNSTAEVDYIIENNLKMLPVEVKASTQGGMKSLWAYMREKHLYKAVRCSLENFGEFDYADKEDNGAIRHVTVCPLYAISRLNTILA